MAVKSRSRRKILRNKGSLTSISMVEKYEKAYFECLRKAKAKLESQNLRKKRKDKKVENVEKVEKEPKKSRKRNLSEYNKFIKENIHAIKGNTQAEKLKAVAKKWNKLKKDKDVVKKPRGRPRKQKS